MAQKDQSELLQGTLELLILKTLSVAPMHGWGISQRIQQVSGASCIVHGCVTRMTPSEWAESGLAYSMTSEGA